MATATFAWAPTQLCTESVTDLAPLAAANGEDCLVMSAAPQPLSATSRAPTARAVAAIVVRRLSVMRVPVMAQAPFLVRRSVGWVTRSSISPRQTMATPATSPTARSPVASPVTTS